MNNPTSGLYVQYGCGLSAPPDWINFDISPTLRIQKAPLLGRILKNRLNTVFPENVRYGDIVRGLPIQENSCDGLYCSHTLEHLSLQDFRKALRNSHKILRPGGIFRCIVPDLELAARNYVSDLDNGDIAANRHFFESTLLGLEKRPRGLIQIAASIWGNARHLWMWDRVSLMEELKNAGFTAIRPCEFHDSADKMFEQVEDISRFENAVSLECKK